MLKQTHSGHRIGRSALPAVWLFVVMLGCGTQRSNVSSVQLNLNELGPFSEKTRLDVVRTYAELPPKVIERIGSDVSNPNGLFNSGDTSIPGVPSRRMIFGYKSDRYCLVHFEQGGISHQFVIVLFELSGNQAVARWAHAGKKFDGVDEFRKRLDQGSLTNDLNEIVW